jgi:peptide deformylase
MTLEIIKYPNPLLARKSHKAVINAELETLVHNMLDTINAFKEPQAAGLSAIQLGIPVQVLIARDFAVSSARDAQGHTTVTTHDFILINPKFVSIAPEKDLDWEGCLSFPDMYGKVWRAKKVKLKYQDLAGNAQRLTASAFLARVIQHEMDHLAGITFNTKIVGKTYTGAELDTTTKVVD